MSLISGKIESIETENQSTPLEKKVITITSSDNQKSFIEFRGPIMIKMLSNFQIGCNVIVPVKYEGKVSKNTGARFNNLVAQSIQKV